MGDGRFSHISYVVLVSNIETESSNRLESRFAIGSHFSVVRSYNGGTLSRKKG